MIHLKNPIIKGFSPDPSVCVVGDDFYLVTSTFSYFPGVPIYHSQDLVNWQQIGNVLERETQVPLTGLTHSQGIYAPCLRYFEGMFYLITTNVPNGGNFIVTATNPEGPWSDPYYLKDAQGIDPSLFFDEDGKCYYVGTRPNQAGVSYNGDWEVWLSELDLKTMTLIGEQTKLWQGALKKAIWPEGPHIYKRGDFYYLLAAEGGTGFEHAISIARSSQITGPYEGNPCNPILTHRHLGKAYPICNVGHGELIEVNQEWYLTCLASRKYNGYSPLGRETFLAKVEWENEWPVINPGEGKLLTEQPHQLPLIASQIEPTCLYFKKDLDKRFLYLRNPEKHRYLIDEKAGSLTLAIAPHKMIDQESPSFLGIRQPSVKFELITDMSFQPREDEEAGIILVQSNLFHIRLVCCCQGEQVGLAVIKCVSGEETLLCWEPMNSDQVNLKISSHGKALAFYFSMPNEPYQKLLSGVDASVFSTESAGGFVGNTLGIYGSSNHQLSTNLATFRWLELVELTENAK